MKTFGALLAFAGVLAAEAACPNQCSGHGRCTENDVCECYKQTGTTWRQRVGYTGADCSQRTCPLGTAFDTLTTSTSDDGVGPVVLTLGRDFQGNVNSNGANAAGFGVYVKGYKFSESLSFDVRITGDNGPFQWKEAGQSTYSAPSSGDYNACTAAAPCELVDNGKINGAFTLDTGVYIYDLGTAASTHAGNVFSFDVNYQEGSTYSNGNSDSAHMQVECSGRGSCDRGSGRCACFPGFNGEACQRTMCPNDCSGHGVCQDQRRFAADAGVATYDTAYDARKQMGCACDDGFRGPDCSQIECPSGADPMGGFGGNGEDAAVNAGAAMDCSGRGLCDYSSGSCSCFKGFFGERCEYQTNFV